MNFLLRGTVAAAAVFASILANDGRAQDQTRLDQLPDHPTILKRVEGRYIFNIEVRRINGISPPVACIGQIFTGSRIYKSAKAQKIDNNTYKCQLTVFINTMVDSSIQPSFHFEAISNATEVPSDDNYYTTINESTRYPSPDKPVLIKRVVYL